MKARCKFRLNSITNYGAGASQYHFMTQYDATIPEDVQFCKATPSGELKVSIDNPAVTAGLKLGELYYLDIIAVEPLAAG